MPNVKQDVLEARLREVYQKGREDGVREGREALMREVRAQRESQEWLKKVQAVEAMAHALKSMADVIVPQRV